MPFKWWLFKAGGSDLVKQLLLQCGIGTRGGFYVI